MTVVEIRRFLFSCGSIFRFGLVFAVVLFGQQTRGFIVGIVSGSHGKVALDGTYLGISLLNLLGHLPILGFATAIDTNGIKALAGDDKKQVGLVVQRTLYLCLVACLPIITLLLLLRPFLELIHEDEEIIDVACHLLGMSVLILPINTASLCLAKYLFIIRRQRAVVYSVITALAMALILLSLTAFSFHLPIWLLYWCYLLTELFQPLLLLLYLRVKKVHLSTWGGWSMAALDKWKDVCATGFPSCAIIFMEWTLWEVFMLILGGRSTEIFVANVVGFTILAISYLLHYGIGISATAHIGQSLASGRVDGARKFIATTLFSTLFSSSILALLALGSKKLISGVFPSPELDRIAPWIYAYVIIDAFQITLNGILRACNRTILPLCITMSSLLLALATGVILLFRPSLAIPSIWIGLTVSGLLACVFLTVLLVKTDLERCASEPLEPIAWHTNHGGEEEGEEREGVVMSALSPGDVVITNHGCNNNTVENGTEENKDGDELRLLPTAVSREDTRRLLLQKGGLFLGGVTMVTIATLLKLSSDTF